MVGSKMTPKLSFQLLCLGIICTIALALDPKCNETVNDGTGHEKIVKFYYNPQLGFCSPFFYTGEGGNANRFDSDHDCMVSCSPKYQEFYPEGDVVCTLKMDPGTCFASIVMYYYDTTEKNCRMFLYRGCQGNGNRFESREDCQTRCRARSGRMLDADSPNPDQQTVDVGLIVGVLGGIIFAVAVISAVAMLVQRKTKRAGMKKVSASEVEMT
ncbi:BPTI/Kunitz domain-containing protein isoform X2 [Electrophorus electricus]|uniref:BPTI/Kunitz domain-containing protein isoform X2 n=1 Tax=Electrophorus electricus TaxID=8005 RepID=UPI0015D025AE|nr:BPTI/Kunitz domain-containing protein isoform X2 [Electrophorus electricus]